MSAPDSTCLLFVQMTVKPEHEASFNRWYESEYIPAFVRDIPGIVRARRFATLAPEANASPAYLTIYEFKDEPALHAGLDVMRARDAWRTLWKEWEGKAVATISDGLYRTTTHLTGSVASGV
jgi:antibiotic biosynthesis monooxygenase (ABM) superfamily enzyme